jgi:acylphosphatase
VFEGDEAAVEGMIRFCGGGPRGAQVEGMDVVDEPPVGETGFSA